MTAINCRVLWPAAGGHLSAFSKLKALLRKAAERTVGALWDRIGTILDAFTLAECANYFKAAGYDPN